VARTQPKFWGSLALTTATAGCGLTSVLTGRPPPCVRGGSAAPGYEVRGTLAGGDGQPVAGAKVSVEATTVENTLMLTTDVTDSSGAFRAQRLAHGIVELACGGSSLDFDVPELRRLSICVERDGQMATIEFDVTHDMITIEPSGLRLVELGELTLD